MNRVLNSTQPIIKNLKHLALNRVRAEEFGETLPAQEIQHWLTQSPFDLSQLSEDELLHFLFVFNALGFCFWGEPKWTVTWKGQDYDGSWGLIVALGKALESGVPILDFAYLADISQEQAGELLAGSVEIPLFEERWQILHEVGAIVSEHYHGKVSNFIEEANGDAPTLVTQLTKILPSFVDTATINGDTIYFDKRAQVMAGTLYHAFHRQGIGKLRNMNQLTTFADYKLPQALRKFGILEYSDELAKKVDNKVELPHNSEEEIEIRAATIWAVEYIEQAAQNHIPHILSVDVGDFIWLLTQTKHLDDKPYHRTRTIAY